MFDGRSEDVGLADASRDIRDRLERRLLPVNLEVLDDLEDDAFECSAVRLTKVERGRYGSDALKVKNIRLLRDERTHNV